MTDLLRVLCRRSKNKIKTFIPIFDIQIDINLYKASQLVDIFNKAIITRAAVLFYNSLILKKTLILDRISIILFSSDTIEINIYGNLYSYIWLYILSLLEFNKKSFLNILGLISSNGKHYFLILAISYSLTMMFKILFSYTQIFY